MNPTQMVTSGLHAKASKRNAENERLKRAYFTYLKEARRFSEASVDAVAKALNRFENYTGFRSFKQFHIQQAIGFKRRLSETTSQATGEPLSKATVYGTCIALRNFYQWLAGQPGFRSRMTYADADYFSLSEKESRIAKARTPKRTPTLEQINHVLSVMPAGTDVELRNRAVIAFAILSGCRDNAIASLRLKHVDLAETRVHQDPREVRTKFAKSMVTTLFPVEGPALRIFEGWVQHLRTTLLFGDDDPLFPATRIQLGSTGLFEASGLDRKYWSNASPIRAIFRAAFTDAGLPYFNPHSFRRTLAVLGQRLCRSPEEFKAWSQNLSHEGVLTTFTSYGQVSSARQDEIIRTLGLKPATSTDDSVLERIKQAASRDVV